jgi:hypothetical protein
MRTLALLLFLLNIGFLAWQLELLPMLPWQPKQFVQTSWPRWSFAPDLPQLVLLSERNLHQTTSDSSRANFTTNEKVALTLPQTHIGIPTSSNGIIPSKTVIKPNAIIPSKTVIKPVTNHPITPKDQGEITPATTTEKPLKKASRVTLNTSPSKLQQVAGIPNISKGQKKSNGKTQPYRSTEPSTIACFRAGPYARTTANKIAKWLRSKKDIIVSVLNGQTQAPTSTWVYLPPFKNRQMARRAKQRLNQRGISHHEIVTIGQFNNAISLGLYRKPVNVKIRLKQLKAKGYKNVKTQKRYKNNTRYRLNVKMPAGQNELLLAFKKNFKGSRLKSVTCK